MNKMELANAWIQICCWADKDGSLPYNLHEFPIFRDTYDGFNMQDYLDYFVISGRLSIEPMGNLRVVNWDKYKPHP
jgi:hypothetical protein